MKILFTGAHHNSALVVLDWVAKNSDSEFVWIGKKYAKDGKLSPEFTEVSSRNVKFYNLRAGKVFRFTNPKYFFHFIFYLLLIPFGFLQALFILLTEKPQVIVSFGGFISVPVVVMGKLLGIKSVTHEQTTSTGLANKINEKFSLKVFTAWPLDNYPAKTSKYEFIGLPIKSSLTRSDFKKSFNSVFSENKSLLYVTGGKSGSVFINQVIFEALPELARQFNIIWSAGNNPGDFGCVYIKKQLLKLEYRDSVYIKEYFGEDEIAQIFQSVDVVVSRSGAHTVYELGVVKKPCILIPLPHTSGNEQFKNAQVLERAGLAKIMEEKNYNKKDFLIALHDLYTHKEEISRNANIELNLNAGEVLGKYILSNF